MAVPKHLRYEILRRDNHTCRYCGAHSPDVELTIDHVTPEALGGSSEPGNLVTACADCNAGKSATPPGAPLVDDVKQQTFEWAGYIREAAQVLALDGDARRSWRECFDGMWRVWDPEPDVEVPRPEDWRTSIENLRVAGLPIRELAEAVVVAMTNELLLAGNVFRYTMGICWNRIRLLQQIAGGLSDEARMKPPEQT